MKSILFFVSKWILRLSRSFEKYKYFSIYNVNMLFKILIAMKNMWIET